MTKTTPTMMMFPDFKPVMDLWARQAQMALDLQAQMLRASMAPWQAMQTGLFGTLRAPFGLSGPAPEPVPVSARKVIAPTPATARPVVDAAAAKPAPAPKVAAPAAATPAPAPKVAAPAAATPAPAPTKEAPSEAMPAAEPKIAEQTEAKPAPVASAPVTQAKPDAATAPAPVAPASATPVAAEMDAPAQMQPKGLAAARAGGPDDLGLIKGIGPKRVEQLHALGLFHHDQIAALTPAEVAWLDESLGGPKGRATADDWVGQAAALVKARARG